MLALRLSVLLSAAVAAAPALPAATDPLAAATVDDHASETIVIDAGRVIVRPGESVEGVKVLVQDGRVLAVGKDVTAPEGAKVVEAAVVCAGFVDAWSTIGVEGTSLNDFATSPGTRTADAFNPYMTGESRSEGLRAGVTAARIQAAPNALMSGLGAIVHLGADAGHAVASDDAGIGATVGITPTRRSPVSGSPWPRATSNSPSSSARTAPASRRTRSIAAMSWRAEH